MKTIKTPYFDSPYYAVYNINNTMETDIYAILGTKVSFDYCVHTSDLNVIVDTFIRNSVESDVWYHVRGDVQISVVSSMQGNMEKTVASTLYDYEY